MQADFEKKKGEKAHQRRIDSQEKHDIYQKMFEKDMDAHRAIHGQSSSNFLKPPKPVDPDASLETVDLNDDETGLEKFLNEDLLYDVSPLPKDEDKSMKQPEHLTVPEPPVAALSTSTSRAESLYFTPDSSAAEKLSEL